MRFKISRLAIASCAVLSTATLTAPAYAHANGQDDAFVAAVASRGFNIPRDQLIAYGHQMCDAMGTPMALGAQLNLMATQGLSPQQSFAVTMDGVRAYCPDKNPFAGLAPPMMPPGLAPPA
jgi:Protein of unknown function (DUF732)